MVYTSYYGGMNLVWWFIWVMLLFWIFALPYDIPGQRRRKENPFDILRKRFASGQITNEQYKEMKAILESELPVQDRL